MKEGRKRASTGTRCEVEVRFCGLVWVSVAKSGLFIAVMFGDVARGRSW